MPKYLIDITFEVEAPNKEDAWLVANSVGTRVEEPDFELEEVSEPWPVD